jgi:hypothetical protein
MPKTKRDLLHAVADKIGGEHGERMRTALKRKTPFDDILDRTMSREAFVSEMKRLESDLPKAFAKMKTMDWEKPGTWGLPN